MALVESFLGPNPLPSGSPTCHILPLNQSKRELYERKPDSINLMANVSSPKVKTNGAPPPQEVRCFIEIEMVGGVNRVVREASGATRKVGRINLVLTPEECQDFATKFYKVCEDGSISQDARFRLFERQITVNLTNAGNALPGLTTESTNTSGWKSFFGRREVASVPASTENAAAGGTVDSNSSQSSFFPKVRSGSRKLRHDMPFVLSGRPQTSEILISTEAATSLDGRWIVFGRVADRESENIVKRIKRYSANTQNKVFIASSGVEGTEASAVPGKPEVSPVAGNTVSSGQVAAA